MPEDDETTENHPSSEDFKELRAKAKRADEAERQLAGLTRKFAFLESGLPADMPGRTFFEKGYDGDLTGEAIRKAAQEAGLWKPPEPEPQVPPSERAAHEAINAASAGAGPTPPVDYNAEIGQAKSVEEVMSILQRAKVPTAWDNQ